MTPRLQLFITLLLHFEGICGVDYRLQRAGGDVVLPSNVGSSSNQCSDVKWTHLNFRKVDKHDKDIYGDIVKTSPGADRMSLSSDCSLIIKRITAEDVGCYRCRIGDKYCSIYRCLNVLTAGINDEVVLHHRAGDDVVLPSNVNSSSGHCPNLDWLYNNIQNIGGHIKVDDGDIVTTSPGADRMSLSSNCSLIINNITAEDAGQYNCWIINTVGSSHTRVHLSVLTVTPSPPDVDPGRDGDVTLHCSLVRDRYFGPCEQNSIIWVNETGTVLLGEGDGFVSGGQNNCVSDLMVKHQRGSKRRFTCQFVEGDRVKINAEYTLDFTVGTGVRTIILYHRVGDDVSLQNNVDLSSSNCSDVEWIYSGDTSSASHEEFGSGAGRMDSNCSLIITNITAGDAGLYESRLRDKYNTVVYLSVLTSGPEEGPGKHIVKVQGAVLGAGPTRETVWEAVLGTLAWAVAWNLAWRDIESKGPVLADKESKGGQGVQGGTRSPRGRLRGTKSPRGDKESKGPA
ncbi:uncharacterized protein LOC133464828 [Cololabis saira]|uniref:uncharacterized protein LOC133464828 n=1 Tax=Cololabis saira TaxID=129043 RepID=UPI002AD439B1|nr:uncharacterized protein LOC133464828 [Cololabis saira]